MGGPPADVRINTVDTQIVVTQGVGPLSESEVEQLVKLVLRHVRRETSEAHVRSREREIRTRSYDVPI